MGALIRRLGVLGVLASLALGLAPVASAATWATFGTPTAKSTYGTGVQFSQPVTIDKPVARVELLLTVADAIGPTVIQVPAPRPRPDRRRSATSSTPPATATCCRTRRSSPAGASSPRATRPTSQLGPVLRVTYADDRFTWQTDPARSSGSTGTREAPTSGGER